MLPSELEPAVAGPDPNIPAPVAPTAPDLTGRTILQVLPALGSQGGVERGTVEVTGAIAAAGGRALVVSAGGPRMAAVRHAGGEHIELTVDTKNPLVIAANAVRLAAILRRESVDLIHARSRAPAWSAWHAAGRAGVPFLTTFHGTYGHGSRLKRAYNQVMTRGERVIAISRFIADHLVAIYGVDPARIRVIHRGVDITTFDPDKVSGVRVSALAGRWRLADGLPVVLLPGRLTRWKGQTVFLEALARLGHTRLQAVILGSDQGRTGYRDELEGLVRHYGLETVVRLIDHCEDIPAAYRLADVVVSASTEPEAFGRIAIEAQAMARPVIATDHGGARETVLPGRTGWLIAPDDAPALTAALDHALKLPTAAREAIGAAGRTHVRSRFTTAQMCRETLAVYAEVLAGAGRR